MLSGGQLPQDWNDTRMAVVKQLMGLNLDMTTGLEFNRPGRCYRHGVAKVVELNPELRKEFLCLK